MERKRDRERNKIKYKHPKNNPTLKSNDNKLSIMAEQGQKAFVKQCFRGRSQGEFNISLNDILIHLNFILGKFFGLLYLIYSSFSIFTPLDSGKDQKERDYFIL